MEIKGIYELLKTNPSLLPHASSEECKYSIFIDNEWLFTGFGRLGYHHSSSFKIVGNYSVASVCWDRSLLKAHIAMQVGNSHPIILKERRKLNPFHINLAPGIDIKRDIMGEVTGRTKVFFHDKYVGWYKPNILMKSDFKGEIVANLNEEEILWFLSIIFATLLIIDYQSKLPPPSGGE